MSERKPVLTTVWKVQKPLGSNDPIPKALFYNKTREYQGFMEYNDGLQRLFGDDLKQYWYGTYYSDGTLELKEQVEEQPW